MTTRRRDKFGGKFTQQTPPGELVERGGCRFINKVYSVLTIPVETIYGPMLELSIIRKDKRPIHNWRHLQRIKNEIAGAECDALELFPKESRLMDTVNVYMLWVFPEGFDFAIGTIGRDTRNGRELTLEEIEERLLTFHKFLEIGAYEQSPWGWLEPHKKKRALLEETALSKIKEARKQGNPEVLDS